MFALIAAILWFLVAIGIDAGALSLVWLGAAFLALHFATDWALPLPGSWRRR